MSAKGMEYYVEGFLFIKESNEKKKLKQIYCNFLPFLCFFLRHELILDNDDVLNGMFSILHVNI